MASSSQAPYPRSPNLSTRSYDSSSVSSTTSPKAPAQYATGGMSTNPRLNAAASTAQLVGVASLPPVTQGFQSYHSLAAPSLGQETLGSNESVASTPGPSTGQGQKRAYRQRRKDPSCDACRERKVKCDATETTSCSECSSRNVKCQFTKETNRRMSSIKQVQDLEKQMDRVKRENSGLRRMLQDRDVPMEVDGDVLEHIPTNPPPINSEPKRRKRPAPVPELARARVNVRDHSKGVWKPPAPYRSTAPVFFEPHRPDLPARHLTDHLLHVYFTSSHTMFPILHSPAFRAEVDRVYSNGARFASPAWLSLFFSVLAAGSLFSPVSSSQTPNTFYEPAEFLEKANKMIDPWANEFTLDHVRALALVAFCLNEMNLKSASWTWLGRAARSGQEIGLHLESGPWPVIEGEMRRRTWWMIYILDRTLATELGRPAMIKDDDCDVSLPAGVDDQYIHEGGMLVPNGAEPLTHSLIAVIHVVRSYTSLLAALTPAAMSTAHLSTLDAHFKSCLGTFPAACDPSSTVPLSPHFLAPLAYLFHGRLLLHRHHLDPGYPTEARMASLESCTRIALETASLLHRSNTSLLADGATALLTTHIFRCTLFLLIAGYADHAISCVRALSSIDRRRDVATPCGRYISFFVATLSSKRAEFTTYLSRNALPSFGGSRPAIDQNALLQMLSQDEELLAYVSADVHASPETSWLWAGAERESSTSGAPPTLLAQGNVTYNELVSPEARTGLSEAEAREWGGWTRLESAIRSLDGRDNITPTPANSTWTLPPPVKSETPGPAVDMLRLGDIPRFKPEAPKVEGSATTSPVLGGSRTSSISAGNSMSTGKDRLSIANII